MHKKYITFLTAQPVSSISTLAAVVLGDVSPVVQALKRAGHVLREHDGL